MIGAVGDIGDAEIGVRLGERVAVDQDLLLAAAPAVGLAAEQGMLAADLVARVVGEGAVRRGHARIVLLDAALHLGEERLLQRLGVGHHRLGVGVLRLEMGADLRIEHRGIAHHRLPVVGAQPGVVVHALDAVMGLTPTGGGRRAARRARRRFALMLWDLLPLRA